MTRSGRILHISPAFFSRSGVIGGAERYALELSRHMADVVPTTLLAFGEKPERIRVGNLDVRIVSRTWRVRGQELNPLSPALVPGVAAASVVHCHQTYVMASSLTALLARMTRRRVFTTDLGGGGFDMSRFFKTDGWFDGHLHISEYSRRIYGHEQNPRAHVILGGVDTEVFSPTPSVRCAGAALFVGRLLPHKGVDDLIRAAEADLPVELACQPYDQRYYALLQELAADKPVRFNFACDGTPAGNVELVAAYRRSLCVVLPSVYRTCFGNETRVPELLGQTLLEGMACGIPAICTNVASMPEVVVDGVTGFVVPPNDPTTLGARLRWLKTHPEQARAMGQAAREHVLKRFTWRSVVDRCLAIYAGDKGSR